MNHSILPFQVIHERLTPKKYRFKHNFFWFKINLTEISSWPTKFFSRNKFNLYSFYDKDHLKLGQKTALDNYKKFVRNNGVKDEIKDVVIFTQLRVLGYVFNPVSFILLTDINNCKYGIIEIGNTFNEQKPFFVNKDCFNGNSFVYKTKKYFYISPFIPHDNELVFKVDFGNNRLFINISDQSQDTKVLNVFFSGKEKKATTLELIKQSIMIPLSTFQTIFFIHYHALRLWLMKIHYFKKEEHLDLQRETYIWKTSKKS